MVQKTLCKYIGNNIIIKSNVCFYFADSIRVLRVQTSAWYRKPDLTETSATASLDKNIVQVSMCWL